MHILIKRIDLPDGQIRRGKGTSGSPEQRSSSGSQLIADMLTGAALFGQQEKLFFGKTC
jgi:hypothetical protein